MRRMSIYCADVNKETAVLRNHQVSEMQKRLKKAIFSDVKTHEERIEPTTPIEKLTALRVSMPQAGYIRQAGLLKILPVSPATLWRWVKKQAFPQPRKLSPRVTAWKIDDVLGWLHANG